LYNFGACRLFCVIRYPKLTINEINNRKSSAEATSKLINKDHRSQDDTDRLLKQGLPEDRIGYSEKQTIHFASGVNIETKDYVGDFARDMGKTVAGNREKKY
jgi:hypothetical protein